MKILNKYNNNFFYLGLALSLFSYFLLSGFSFIIFSMAAILMTALCSED